MKAKILGLGLLMTICCLQAAAQALQVLGETHAMLRIDVQGRYLLLPVEEKEENASVNVVVDNQKVQSFNVKLATDKVDYFVPFDLTRLKARNVLLDITFHGNRRTTGAINNYACWSEIRQSDSFDTANRERFRPAYHHTPLYGWMNDPNGMFYKDGEWHLYYQWNPYGSQWENMTWGHSVSRDLIHWEAMPTAIEPDGLGTIFSGSCVVDKENTAGFGKNAVVAFYTSAGQSQMQSMAYSTDNGRTFTKYEHNPVITANVPDFRDPHLFWYEPTKRWIMLLAVGQEMHIYSSPNLKQWTKESTFGHDYGCHDGVWECPDLFELESKWVLVCNINPGGPYGGSATQYFVGDFDGHRFTCDHQDTRWMDYGKDHYATVTFDNAPDNRRVAIAWMSNWQYANQVPTMQFRSANSIPRDLGLFADNGEYYCSVKPSKEMLALRGKKQKGLTDACELVVDLNGSAQITLSNDKDEQVVMDYDAAKQTFVMDRRQSGDVSFSNDFATITTAPTHGQLRQLRIFIDRCSIEAFDADGHMAMTNLVFPSEPYSRLKVKGGKATVYELK